MDARLQRLLEPRHYEHIEKWPGRMERLKGSADGARRCDTNHGNRNRAALVGTARHDLAENVLHVADLVGVAGAQDGREGNRNGRR